MRSPSEAREASIDLGAYRATALIGEGASGIVYRAVAPNGAPIALKVLRDELSLSERERQRFLDEAERMRRVRHPALVEVVDAGILPGGRAFIAMPFLEGTSLADRLQRGPMPFDVALQLFEQLADGLQALHRAGLVHRDIKPENIFVVEGDGRALLLDLGIARELGAAPSTTTHAGMIRGTPAYMAPERFFGAPASPATDIYELGVVLYLTIVGSLPWARFDDPTERMRPAPPAARGVVLPPRLSTTLMRALAASPGERPESAHAFAAAVLDALSPESAKQIAGAKTALLASQAPDAPPGAPLSPRSPPKKSATGLVFAAMTGASLFATGLGVLLFVTFRRAEPPQPIAIAPSPSPTSASPHGGVGTTSPPTAPQQSGETLAQADDEAAVVRSASAATAASASTSAARPASQSAASPVPRPPAPSQTLDGSNCRKLVAYVCSEEYERVKTSGECRHWNDLSTIKRDPGVADGLCRVELHQRLRIWRASNPR